MKTYWQRVLFTFFVILVLISLSSCYQFESGQTSDYVEFYNDMNEKNMSFLEFVPAVSLADNITESYLFYTDRDLVDSTYIIYVESIYNEAEYSAEKERLMRFCGSNVQEDDSFPLPVVLSHDYLSTHTSGFWIWPPMSPSTYITSRYGYALFDESEYRIIYMCFFLKGPDSDYKNLPREYLPKELLEFL